MKKLHHSALLLLVGMGLASACGGDDDSDNPNTAGKGGTGGKGSGGDAGESTGGTTGGKSGGTAGKGSSTGGKGGSGTGGSTGGSGNPEGGTGEVGNEGGTTAEGGSSAQAGDTGSGGSTGGSAGTGVIPPECVIYDDDREVAEIPTDGSGNIDFGSEDELTLTSDKTWTINGRIFVPDGKTLRIDPCTLIEGTRKPNAGTLFVMRGGKLIAEGEADKPIVFSSDDNEFHSSAPWGGVVLLGKATVGPNVGVNLGEQEKLFEGLTDERATYGCDGADCITDNADSSGVLKYVRVEYGGDIIAADKEVNGLSFGGVGSGTVVSHVMVKRQMDDCFEFFGGTVNADHLICQDTGDDMFDTDLDYRGYLQFLFGRVLTFGTSSDPNGFEWDGNQDNQTGTEEAGTPHAANATLCGIAVKTPAVSYGAVLRRRLQPGTSIINTIVTGFDSGADTRDAMVDGSLNPVVSWTHSLFALNFGVLPTASPANPAYFDNWGVPGETDNDAGFDEVAWLQDGANNNDNGDGGATLGGAVPAGFDCYSNPPTPFPDTEVAGGEPEAGFDTSANYVGAFKNADDNWMTGLWVNWD